MRRSIAFSELLRHPNLVRCMGQWEEADIIYVGECCAQRQQLQQLNCRMFDCSSSSSRGGWTMAEFRWSLGSCIVALGLQADVAGCVLQRYLCHYWCPPVSRLG